MSENHRAATREELGAVKGRVVPLGTRRTGTRAVVRCALCGEAVSRRDDFVRLYRRTWHLDCILDDADRMPAPPR